MDLKTIATEINLRLSAVDRALDNARIGSVYRTASELVDDAAKIEEYLKNGKEASE